MLDGHRQKHCCSLQVSVATACTSEAERVNKVSGRGPVMKAVGRPDVSCNAIEGSE